MKVYGINYDGRYRHIVAAKSKAAAGRLFGVSSRHTTEYCEETGNREEVALAMQEASVVWRILDHVHGAAWERVTPPPSYFPVGTVTAPGNEATLAQPLTTASSSRS